MKSRDKLKNLVKILSNLNKIAIAFSGGLDSSFLAFLSRRVLGKENVIALTIYSPLRISKYELEETKNIASKLDITHKIIEIDFPEKIRFNPVDRCYHCKKEIYSELQNIAKEDGYTYLCDGTNANDLNDYRPGLKAIRELNIKTPLLDAGLTKDDIRYFAKKFGLSFWNKPSNSCLITRLPYNTEVTQALIDKIERAESFIKKFGVRIVRVRVHNELARVEVDEKEMKKILRKDILLKIDSELKNIGFKFVTIDCKGYKMGSMNG